MLPHWKLEQQQRTGDRLIVDARRLFLRPSMMSSDGHLPDVMVETSLGLRDELNQHKREVVWKAQQPTMRLRFRILIALLLSMLVGRESRRYYKSQHQT
jgi:hypothetical protein